jgi:hypothetical protein
MYLVNDKALIARSSSQILCFKQVVDKFTLEKTWKCYRVLEHRGFIYFIKGNKRIQITTDKKIYVYLIDPDTFELKLENVINNFMNCTQLMFGSKVRYGISFKTNQKSFDIWSRKYEHSFNANVVKKNLDGSIGLPVETMDAFLVGRGNEVRFYNVDTYQEEEEALITIPLIKSQTREAAEIIGMQKSKDEQVLAVISGKNLVMAEQFANQLFIYKRMKGTGGDPDTF